MEADAWKPGPFVAWVRGELRRREWTQADFARKLNVPNGTVARWLGSGRRPSSASCDRIADVFGVDVDTVLTLAGHRPTAEPLATDDARARYAAMLRRIRLDPDRELVLESILTAWLDADRARRD